MAAAGDAASPDITRSADDVRNMAQLAVNPELEDGKGEVRGGTEALPQAELLRDIVGNPFRPLGTGPSWLTTTVTALAHGIYEERAFDRLPILADALEEAGCDNAEILGHVRGPGPHVRGCQVLDLLLGKT